MATTEATHNDNVDPTSGSALWVHGFMGLALTILFGISLFVNRVSIDATVMALQITVLAVALLPTMILNHALPEREVVEPVRVVVAEETAEERRLRLSAKRVLFGMVPLFGCYIVGLPFLFSSGLILNIPFWLFQGIFMAVCVAILILLTWLVVIQVKLRKESLNSRTGNNL